MYNYSLSAFTSKNNNKKDNITSNLSETLEKTIEQEKKDNKFSLKNESEPFSSNYQLLNEKMSESYNLFRLNALRSVFAYKENNWKESTDIVFSNTGDKNLKKHHDMVQEYISRECIKFTEGIFEDKNNPNHIQVVRRIGSESSNGMVYHARIYDENSSFPLAVKLMPVTRYTRFLDNYRELN